MDRRGASASWTKNSFSAGTASARPGQVVAEAEGVEAVEDQAERGVVGAAHDVPGLAPAVDVRAPGQRLVAHEEPAAPRALGHLAQVGGGAFRLRQRRGLDVGAHQHHAGAELLPWCRICARRGRGCGGAAAPASIRSRGRAGTARPPGRGRSTCRPASAAVPSKVSRSFSKISTASKPAAAAASSLSGRVPERQTVAMERFGRMCRPPLAASGVEEHRLVRALQADVEHVGRRAAGPRGVAPREQGAAALRRVDDVEHRVGGVGRFLVGEVEARGRGRG